MTAAIIDIRTRKPVERVTQVIIAEPICYPARLTFNAVKVICDRALSTLTIGNAGPAAKRVARQTLEWVARGCDFPQGRSLAASHLRAVERHEGGAA